MLLLSNQRGEIEGTGGELGGSAEVVVGAGSPGGDVGGQPIPDVVPSIYGDLAVEWPEGLADDLKNEPSLKPFVGKEGKVNTAALLKSYHETKKAFGKDKVILPDDTFDADRTKEFWGKLGAKDSADQYEVKVAEGSLLQEKFVNDMKTFAAENHIPVGTVQKMADFMEAQSLTAKTESDESFNTKIAESLEPIKKEYGAAYDLNINMAKRVINEVSGLSDDEKAIFSDPTIGSNPSVIKILVNIGKKLFKEDGIQGTSDSGLLSPEQAQDEINKIYNDKSHVFHNSRAAGHQEAQKKMLRLFSMKSGLPA
jgi:hypothetical protein